MAHRRVAAKPSSSPALNGHRPQDRKGHPPVPKAYRIFLGSRTPSKRKEAVGELRKIVPQGASTLELVQVDVTDDDSINKAAELVKSKFDKLGVLIGNAGTPCLGIRPLI